MPEFQVINDQISQDQMDFIRALTRRTGETNGHVQRVCLANFHQRLDCLSTRQASTLIDWLKAVEVGLDWRWSDWIA